MIRSGWQDDLPGAVGLMGSTLLWEIGLVTFRGGNRHVRIRVDLYVLLDVLLPDPGKGVLFLTLTESLLTSRSLLA